MAQHKHWIKVMVGGSERPVRLGDIVWFFVQCNIDSLPQVGVITRISEDFMVDLSILNIGFGGKTRHEHVCLFGTEKLNVPANRNKGCWLPRPSPEEILGLDAREG
jgi:hypothetical protein